MRRKLCLLAEVVTWRFCPDTSRTLSLDGQVTDLLRAKHSSYLHKDFRPGTTRAEVTADSCRQLY